MVESVTFFECANLHNIALFLKFRFQKKLLIILTVKIQLIQHDKIVI